MLWALVCCMHKAHYYCGNLPSMNGKEFIFPHALL